MAVTWPDNFPVPLEDSFQETFGDNMERRVCGSGRTEVRRFGSGSTPSIVTTLRLRNDVVTPKEFELFYSNDLNMGLNWIDAPWVASVLGYPGCYARISGYMKKSAVGKIYSDFSVILQIKKASECWADTTWG